MDQGRRTGSRVSGSIMRVSVAFQNERLELEVADDRLIGHWSGPDGVAARGPDAGRMVLDALERPLDFPPLRQAVVPGDRVAIAYDADLPDARPVLEAVCLVLQRAGVESDAITVLVAAEAPNALTDSLPPGARLVRHDPA